MSFAYFAYEKLVLLKRDLTRPHTKGRLLQFFPYHIYYGTKTKMALSSYYRYHFFTSDRNFKVAGRKDYKSHPKITTLFIYITVFSSVSWPDIASNTFRIHYSSLHPTNTFPVIRFSIFYVCVYFSEHIPLHIQFIWHLHLHGYPHGWKSAPAMGQIVRGD